MIETAVRKTETENNEERRVKKLKQEDKESGIGEWEKEGKESQTGIFMESQVKRQENRELRN